MSLALQYREKFYLRNWNKQRRIQDFKKGCYFLFFFYYQTLLFWLKATLQIIKYFTFLSHMSRPKSGRMVTISILHGGEGLGMS